MTVMSTAELTRYTPEDLLEMPDGDRYELVNGQLVEKDMGGKSSWIGGEVFGELRSYARKHGGWAFPGDTSFQCFGFEPDKVRKPDAAYVSAGRFEKDEIPDGHIPIPPDVAVEVVSPNDIYTAVEDKVDEYLRAGVKLVWVINPAHRNIRVFDTSVEQGRQYGPNDELTAPDVLPGFRCKIADFFGGESKAATSNS